MKDIDLTSSDVLHLSKQLLGYKLCTRVDGVTTTGIIVETEAYRAPEDKASHAYNGRRTSRTETIFQRGGISYVYLCYGIHHLFNVVTGPKDTAHAILIRALEPLGGIPIMQERRGLSVPESRLTNGPGKLCQALGITKALDGVDLTGQENSKVWLEKGISVDPSEIVASKRVGIDYAEEWKEKLWRFYINGNLHVSVIDRQVKI